MKMQIKSYTALIVSVVIISSFGCDQANLEDQRQDRDVVKLYENGLSYVGKKCATSVWYPKSETKIGTKKGIKIREDGKYNMEPAVFRVSSAYRLVAMSDGQVTSLKSSPEVTCHCKGEGSCTVEINPDQGTASCQDYGECSDDCYMQISTAEEQARMTIPAGKPAGYIESNSEVQFLRSGETSPSAFAAMFELPDIRESVRAFAADLHPNQDHFKLHRDQAGVEAPSGMVFAALQISGRVAFLPVSPDQVPSSTLTSRSLACEGGLCAPVASNTAVRGPVIVQF